MLVCWGNEQGHEHYKVLTNNKCAFEGMKMSQEKRRRALSLWK